MDENLHGSVDFSFFDDDTQTGLPKPSDNAILGSKVIINPITLSKHDDNVGNNIQNDHEINNFTNNNNLDSLLGNNVVASTSKLNLYNDATCDVFDFENVVDGSSETAFEYASTFSKDDVNLETNAATLNIGNNVDVLDSELKTKGDDLKEMTKHIEFNTADNSIDNNCSNDNTANIKNNTSSIITSSSSACSHSEPSVSDDDSSTDKVINYKRNVTFSNSGSSAISGRVSRLSHYTKRRPSRKETKHNPKNSTKNENEHFSVSDNLNFNKAPNHKESSSELTDVSPLSSSNDSSLERKNRSKTSSSTIDYKDLIKEKVNTTEVKTWSTSESNLHNKPDSMEFKLLMQAVYELDKDNKRHGKKDKNKVEKLSYPDQNFSFTESQCRLIEQENQRLLSEISKKRLPTSSRAVELVKRRLPSSAINRYKEQQKIEAQNLDFLTRLCRVKPTKALTRDQQISDYNKHVQYGTNTMQHLARSRQVRSVSVCGESCSSTNASDRNSLRRAGNSYNARRRSLSATSKSKESRRRPVWESRW